MADKITAAESIRRLAFLYRDMSEAADALESIGKLEQATKEAEKAQSSAAAELDGIKAEVKKAKDDIKKAQEKAAQIVADAQTEASQIAAQAIEDADAVVVNAKASAQSIIDKAAKDVADASMGVAGRVAELTTTKVGLEQDVASLQSAILVKQAEAEDIEKRLAKAQAQIAKLLG